MTKAFRHSLGEDTCVLWNTSKPRFLSFTQPHVYRSSRAGSFTVNGKSWRELGITIA